MKYEISKRKEVKRRARYGGGGREGIWRSRITEIDGS